MYKKAIYHYDVVDSTVQFLNFTLWYVKPQRFMKRPGYYAYFKKYYMEIESNAPSGYFV